MSALRCQMAPLVEARRDRRLDDREAASIDRHLAVCAGCRALDRDLALIATIAGGDPDPITTLAHRRGRMRLLNEAALFSQGREALRARGDRSTRGWVSAMASQGRAGWKVPAVALAAAVLFALGSWRARLGEGSAAAAAEPPAGISRAAVERRSVAEIARVASPAARSVGADREAPVREAPVREAKGVKPAARAQVGKDAKAFADGVGSLARGNFGEAIERLDAFRKNNPGDARAEDAAFLVVMALDRAGKRDAAAQAAREYLVAYPEGYRRGEAAVIASRRD